MLVVLENLQLTRTSAQYIGGHPLLLRQARNMSRWMFPLHRPACPDLARSAMLEAPANMASAARGWAPSALTWFIKNRSATLDRSLFV